MKLVKLVKLVKLASMAKAKLSYLHIAPRKVRLVADLIRGESVAKAETQLQFLRKRAALPMLKLLRSAVANKKHADKKEADTRRLFVKSIRVDQGPAYKRFQPQPRGRAALIKKITSHVTLEIEER